MRTAPERSLRMISKHDRLRRISIAALLFFAAISAASLNSIETNAQQQRDCPVRVTLLQVNDVYQFAPVDGGKRGGLARVLTLKKAIEKQSPNSLFLLSGDTISPSVESITYK